MIARHDLLLVLGPVCLRVKISPKLEQHISRLSSTGPVPLFL